MPTLNIWGPCGVVANVLDCDFAVTEFELQSRNYVHFWTKEKVWTLFVDILR